MTAVAFVGAGGVALVLVLLVAALSGGGVRGALNKRARTIRDRSAGRAPTTAAGPAAVSLKRPEARKIAFVEDCARRLLPRQSVLRYRLQRTGKQITIGNYVLLNLAVAAFGTAAAMLFVGLAVQPAALFGAAFGIVVPHMAVGMIIGRRRARFLTVFPDAIDLIVRGLRSGLPVTESIAAVGREMPDPLGGEFHRVSDAIRFGRRTEDALWDTAKRLDIPEFNFFVVSLSIQQETGGNLGETLANLSELLRSRHQMRLKIKALSSEAKASAYILGSLPFIMFAIVYVMNSGYAGMLLTDPRGIMMTGGGLFSVLICVAVMAKMIKFDI